MGSFVLRSLKTPNYVAISNLKIYVSCDSTEECEYAGSDIFKYDLFSSVERRSKSVKK